MGDLKNHERKLRSVLSLEANGAPAFVRIMSKIPVIDSNKLIDVVDHKTCEVQGLKAYTVLANALHSKYPNDEYLNKDFKIRRIEPLPGKLYYQFEIVEIKIDKSEESNLQISKCYADYLKQQPPERALDTPNETSRLLGFNDYEEYRRSSLWKKIKRRVKERDSNLCARCESKADLVHHRSYALEVLRGEDDEQLASVCEGCHNVIHFDDQSNKHKRNPQEWDSVLVQKDLSTGFPPPKVDLRLRWRKDPPEWPRMTAKQRIAYHLEYEKLRYIRML
ncbi:MAG: hypothetical protein WA634_14585 [Silvibacterium sp.]